MYGSRTSFEVYGVRFRVSFSKTALRRDPIHDMPLGIEVTFGIGCVNRSQYALIICSIMRINVYFLCVLETIITLISFFEYTYNRVLYV